MGVRAVFEAKLEQVIEGPAYQGAGREPQMAHNFTAVQVGADGSELLYLAKLSYACLELVHPLRQGSCTGRVPGSAVGTRQLVELLEKVAGVPHVAADSAVRPAHPVGMEAEVQFD